jgi:hypothetical protein
MSNSCITVNTVSTLRKRVSTSNQTRPAGGRVLETIFRKNVEAGSLAKEEAEPWGVRPERYILAIVSALSSGSSLRVRAEAPTLCQRLTRNAREDARAAGFKTTHFAGTIAD